MAPNKCLEDLLKLILLKCPQIEIFTPYTVVDFATYSKNVMLQSIMPHKS